MSIEQPIGSESCAPEERNVYSKSESPESKVPKYPACCSSILGSLSLEWFGEFPGICDRQQLALIYPRKKRR